MFNSQKINNDPFPYVSESGTRHANPGWLNSEYFSNRRERAEYDNNPNPILVWFREANKKGVKAEYVDLNYAEDEGEDVEHIIHARRVLEKLVNVYG